MGCRFTELVIDSREPMAIARFWSNVLGYEIHEEGDVALLEPTEERAPSLVFVPVPEVKKVKNRVHIDVNPTDRTRDDEVERIVGLGARRVDIGQGEVSWVVLADPEGNEFCVLRSQKP
jgi:hypothetical protein